MVQPLTYINGSTKCYDCIAVIFDFRFVCSNSGVQCPYGGFIVLVANVSVQWVEVL